MTDKQKRCGKQYETDLTELILDPELIGDKSKTEEHSESAEEYDPNYVPCWCEGGSHYCGC